MMPGETPNNFNTGRFGAPRNYARGGKLPELAEILRRAGRGDDKVLAHIHPMEALELSKKYGFSGINPQTGLPEYGKKWKKLQNFSKRFLPHVGAAIGSAVMGPVGGVVGGGIGGGLSGRRDASGKRNFLSNVGRGLGQGAMVGAGMGLGQGLMGGNPMAGFGGSSNPLSGLFGSGSNPLSGLFGGGGNARGGSSMNMLGSLFGGGAGGGSNQTPEQQQEQSSNPLSGLFGSLGMSPGQGLLGLASLLALSKGRKKDKKEQEKNQFAQLPEYMRPKEEPEVIFKPTKFIDRKYVKRPDIYEPGEGPEHIYFEPDLAGYAHGGFLEGNGLGQADDIEIMVPPNSYILDSSTVSDIGDGNTIAGKKIIRNQVMKLKTPQKMSGMKHGGMMPIRISDGEEIIPPDAVASLGNGNVDKGAKNLDKMVKKVRRKKRTSGKKLPPKMNMNVRFAKMVGGK